MGFVLVFQPHPPTPSPTSREGEQTPLSRFWERDRLERSESQGEGR